MASPPAGATYVMTGSDEFNVAGATLDPSRWTNKYLQHWTNVDTSARYTIVDGAIRLRIDPNTSPWDPAHDGDTRISSIQTGEKDYLHRWANYNGINHHEQTAWQHVQKYGYFEIRAKAQTGGGIHSAWWMVGTQNDQVNGGATKQNGEVDIFEIVGREPSVAMFNWLRWNDPQPNETTRVQANVDLSADFHTYGFLWEPGKMTLSIDGVERQVINKSPDYPMVTLLGIYEKRVNGWTGPFDASVPYPKEFVVDYWRAYMKVPTLPYTFEADDAALYGTARSMTLAGASGSRVLGYVGQGEANKAMYGQLYSPNASTRQLTIRYASGEARSVTYRVNGGSAQTVAMPATGGWTTFGTKNISVPLNAGVNQIEFWNATGWAPDIDSITVN
ncbi:MAG: family 16 glycosylhydrolase [Microbacteriaceae bacterium]